MTKVMTNKQIMDTNFNVGGSYWFHGIKHIALRNNFGMSFAGKPAHSVSDYDLVTVVGGYYEVLVVSDESGAIAIFQQDNGPDDPLSYTRIK